MRDSGRTRHRHEASIAYRRLDHGFDGGWNGNAVKTAVAFCIRRSVDGTADEFYAGLVSLLKLYDAAALNDGAAPDGGD